MDSRRKICTKDLSVDVMNKPRKINKNLEPE